MAAPAVLETEKTYFVRTEKEPDYLDFTENYRPLWGSEARFNAEGTIAYLTYRDIANDIALSPALILIPKGESSEEIFSREPVSKVAAKEIRVNHIHGGVERAIRAMDHILEKPTQIIAMGFRAHELLDILTDDFAAITKQAFALAKVKTVQLLERVGLDPKSTIDYETRQIEEWLVKGSFGEDSLGRRNKLITTMALSAAYRHAIILWKGVGPKTGKFIKMRKALIFERQFSRSMFTDVLDWLRPEALPAHMLFKYPTSKSDNVGIVLGILDNLQFQLRQPRVKPYRPVGQEAEARIAEAVSLLREHQQDRTEIVEYERDLFHQAFNLLTHTLYKYGLSNC